MRETDSPPKDGKIEQIVMDGCWGEVTGTGDQMGRRWKREMRKGIPRETAEIKAT